MKHKPAPGRRQHSPAQGAETPRISVALASYKGESYITAQLESIAAQTLLPAEVIITDDTSPDATATRIASFAATAPLPVRLHRNPANLGVIGNFGKAISLCASPYIALADQDDVWLPTKLEETYAAMRQAESTYGTHTPILVHTGVQVVDANLRPLGTRMARPSRLLSLLPAPVGLALQNTVTGCTVLFNRALAQAALPFPPETLMHDHWLALVAAQRGHVVTLPGATLLYRQHGGNAVGAGTGSLAAKLATARGNLLGKWRQYRALMRAGA